MSAHMNLLYLPLLFLQSFRVPGTEGDYPSHASSHHILKLKIRWGAGAGTRWLPLEMSSGSFGWRIDCERNLHYIVGGLRLLFFLLFITKRNRPFPTGMLTPTSYSASTWWNFCNFFTSWAQSGATWVTNLPALFVHWYPPICGIILFDPPIDGSRGWRSFRQSF